MSIPLTIKGKELHVASVWSDAAQRGTTGYSYCINKVAQGTAIDERIGRMADMETLELFAFQMRPAGAGVSDFGRILVVRDNASLAATATTAEVMETSISVQYALDPINIYLYQNRFKLLFDHTFPTVTGGAAMPPGCNLHAHIKIPKSCRRSVWGGTVSDEPTQGALLVLLLSYACSATADNNVLLGYHSVLRFTDA
jgi:hypothetical protein